MSNLEEFLLARFDEDKAKIRRPHTISGSRALREVEAKQNIAWKHRPRQLGEDPCRTCEHVWPCGTVRWVAHVYSSHPDYDPQWKP